MTQESINKVRVWMAEQGVDAFLVTQPLQSYLSQWLV